MNGVNAFVRHQQLADINTEHESMVARKRRLAGVDADERAVALEGDDWAEREQGQS